jgi:hypothetical protein
MLRDNIPWLETSFFRLIELKIIKIDYNAEGKVKVFVLTFSVIPS